MPLGGGGERATPAAVGDAGRDDGGVEDGRGVGWGASRSGVSLHLSPAADLRTRGWQGRHGVSAQARMERASNAHGRQHVTMLARVAAGQGERTRGATRCSTCWGWLARGRLKRPGCVIRSWTGGRRVPAVRGPSPTLDTPEVPITLKPRKCTSLRCAPARGAAEAERRQGPASGLSWERGGAGHTSVTLSRPQTRAAREALEMPRSTGRNPARLSRERHDA